MLRPVIAWAIVLALGGAAAPVVSAESATAEVTYISGSSVYLSAGSDDGVAVGQRLALTRDGQRVATLEVAEVSNHRAVCTALEVVLEPVVGDRVSFARQQPASTTPSPNATTSDERDSRRRRHDSVRGRIGVSYLAVRDRTEETGDYSQPAIDLRLDGRRVAGSDWGFAVDARARRTLASAADGTEQDERRTRVYRLALTRRSADDPWTFTLGRQTSAAVATVSVFDGVSAAYGHERWSVGAFSGSQPDRENFGYSSEIQEHGAYFQFGGVHESLRNWQVTAGLIGSYDNSEVNREFVYLQGRYTTRRFSTYVAQEVDYNRDWKIDEGEDTVSPTSTFASLRVQATRILSFHGGYDNRRNVRLYRDLVTPVTEFDDSFRRGLWGGATLSIAGRYRLGLDARSNRHEGDGDARSYTVNLGANRIGGSKIDANARGTRYTNETVEGWLYAVDAGIVVARRWYVRLQGGLRDETNLTGVVPDQSQRWLGIENELSLGRRWFWLLALERSDGDLDEVDQLYSRLTYRF